MIQYVTETKVLKAFAASKKLRLDFRRSLGGRSAGWFEFPNSGLYKLSLVNAFAACCLNRESSIIQLQILQTDL